MVSTAYMKKVDREVARYDRNAALRRAQAESFFDDIADPEAKVFTVERTVGFVLWFTAFIFLGIEVVKHV